jgi:hypothetical protein
MSKAIKRRTVYAATILAMLVMSGGFVLASVLTGITVVQTGQNAGSITAPTNTIFAAPPATLTITLIQATAPGCAANGSTTLWTSGAPTANVYVSGTAGCSLNTNDWFEELTWTGVHSPGFVGASGSSDTFFIDTTFTGSPGSYSATFIIADHLASDPAFTGTLNVFLDAGQSANGGLPNAYLGVSIAVSGN